MCHWSDCDNVVLDLKTVKFHNVLSHPRNVEGSRPRILMIGTLTGVSENVDKIYEILLFLNLSQHLQAISWHHFQLMVVSPVTIINICGSRDQTVTHVQC